MSIQLHNFFHSVLKMPHYSNQHQSGGVRHTNHEDALTELLVKEGYSEDFNKSKYVKLKRSSVIQAADLEGEERQKFLENILPDMLEGTFIRQPAGSQSFPDFLIKDFGGRFILVEAKSGGGVSPVWNDSRPRKDSIYIMSSGVYDKSTIWLGQDWITYDQTIVLDQLYKDIEKLVYETNEKLKTLDTFNRGFQFYSRKKHQQGGKSTNTDPFRHPDREKCENNVLEFTKG